MDFPKPPPDRRKQDSTSSKQEKPKEFQSKIFQVLKQNVIELREKLSDFKIMKKESLSPSQVSRSIPENINIILFGPSGSGKSSLIKTFYQAYHNLPTLSQDLKEKLIIKGLDLNEGTKKFTKAVIKEGKKSLISSGDCHLIIENSGIIAFDTRGQILMDQKESSQLELLINGKVKDLSLVEQRNFRYAYLLWEFWKKDCELFPKEILKKEDVKTQPHALIFVFDGSLEEVPNGPEETMFYKQIIEKSRAKKYFYPQIVLTRVDKVEERLEKEFKKQGIEDFDRETKLREIIDAKIESVVTKLNIPRSSVHFLENYHENKENADISIDYYSLKLLEETVRQGEAFIAAWIKEKEEKCKLF